jgi:hypothetical protein
VLIAFERVGKNILLLAQCVDEVDGNVIADKIKVAPVPTVPFRIGPQNSLRWLPQNRSLPATRICLPLPCEGHLGLPEVVNLFN